MSGDVGGDEPPAEVYEPPASDSECECEADDPEDVVAA